MKLPNEIFYSLSNDGILEQFEDLLSAFNSKSRYILSQESKTVPNFTYNNLYIDCKLYDGIAKNILTTILDWNISEITTKMDGYHKTTLSMKVEDSNGIEKNIEFKNFHSKQERLFNFLAELEVAKNCKEYDSQHLTSEILVFENKILELKQNLKSEIFDLEEDYKKNKHTLKSEIRRLKQDFQNIDEKVNSKII